MYSRWSAFAAWALAIACSVMPPTASDQIDEHRQERQQNQKDIPPGLAAELVDGEQVINDPNKTMK
jgi:hypothetical protein